MEVNVVAHEGGDEVVGVVVEGLHPQLHIVAVLGGCHDSWPMKKFFGFSWFSKKPSAVPWSIRTGA